MLITIVKFLRHDKEQSTLSLSLSHFYLFFFPSLLSFKMEFSLL